MAGRIRTLKPELLEDAKTAGLSDTAFRLFVSAILLADDYGNLRAEPGYLRGQIWWKREPSAAFDAALDELAPLVALYEVNGQRYGHIRGWTKHQRVDRPGKPRCPPPPSIPPPEPPHYQPAASFDDEVKHGGAKP